MSTQLFTIHTDGGSRGNPGPAAYAFVIERPGEVDIEEKACLPDTTNNIAEYTALVRALERALELGAKKVVIRSDSELMVKQLQGLYKVKNEGLRPLYEEARELVREFDSVRFQHVPREQNARADRLCNEAMDAAGKPKSGPTRNAFATAHQGGEDGVVSAQVHTTASKRLAQAPKETPQPPEVREQALECLRSVAAAWARGNPNNPSPEVVWEQLWSILEESNVLKTGRKS